MGCGASVSQGIGVAEHCDASTSKRFHDTDEPRTTEASIEASQNASEDGTKSTKSAGTATEPLKPSKEPLVASKPQPKSAKPEKATGANSFARLFRSYSEEKGDWGRPTSRPQYDPLMDEIFEVKEREQAERQREPLVSPKYVMRAAEILGVDLLEEPFLVPLLKSSLPSLSNAYQRGGLQEELFLVEVALAKERQARQYQEVPRELGCEECGEAAIDYCPACEGLFCRSCFERLHAKGRRSEHPRLELSMAGFKMKSESVQSQQIVHVQWHPFHDGQGLRYYYNFETQRSVRQLSRKELVWRPPPPLPENGREEA
ncbi:unnamed protein product [Durusdinium trenchii]